MRYNNATKWATDFVQLIHVAQWISRDLRIPEGKSLPHSNDRQYHHIDLEISVFYSETTRKR